MASLMLMFTSSMTKSLMMVCVAQISLTLVACLVIPVLSHARELKIVPLAGKGKRIMKG